MSPFVSVIFLNICFIVCTFLSASPFDFGYSGLDVVKLKSILLRTVEMLFVRRVDDDHQIILLVGPQVAGQTNLCTESSCTFGAWDGGRG